MSPVRIQRRRVKGWRMSEGAVYVGRPTVYGNPFRAGVDFCGPTIRCLYTSAELVDGFRSWLTQDTLHHLFWDRELIVTHVHLRAALKRGDLRGKNLACWCPLVDSNGVPVPCHADVLLEVANGGAA